MNKEVLEKLISATLSSLKFCVSVFYQTTQTLAVLVRILKQNSILLLSRTVEHNSPTLEKQIKDVT